MEIIYNETGLKERLKYWQHALRLDFWDITIKIGRMANMVIKGVDGEITYSLPNAEADITILNPIDYNDSAFPQDMEETLVHELLHLHMATFEPADAEKVNSMLWERTIDQLAKVMVHLNDKNRKSE